MPRLLAGRWPKDAYDVEGCRPRPCRCPIDAKAEALGLAGLAQPSSPAPDRLVSSPASRQNGRHPAADSTDIARGVDERWLPAGGGRLVL